MPLNFYKTTRVIAFRLHVMVASVELDTRTSFSDLDQMLRLLCMWWWSWPISRWGGSLIILNASWLSICMPCSLLFPLIFSDVLYCKGCTCYTVFPNALWGSYASLCNVQTKYLQTALHLAVSVLQWIFLEFPKSERLQEKMLLVLSGIGSGYNVGH